ncbi:MAG: tetratricopeptide repeat protein, partial [Candidatus Dormibacteraeota bacterium]|nr:tetratricopeptide repeat protein [Candidatus Dormibacteraeota bacterium]
LGVFVGGATYSAIEAVCNGTGDLRSDVLISLDSLLRKSLLRREPTADEPRVAMLETIREYALERLTAGGDAATLHRLHAEYFLAMAEAAEPQLAGDERKLWLAQLERDHDNLRAALAWMAAHGELEMEARLAGSLGSFWQIHGHVPEGRRRLYAVFARSAGVAAPLRARVLLEAGNLAAHESDYHEAVNLYQESLGLFGAAGDGRTCGYLLYGLAKVLDALGDTAGALTALRQGLVLSRGSGDLAVAASTLNMLGTLTFYYSAADEGIAYYEESLALYREAGDKLGASNVLNNLGEVARLRDDYAAADALYEESLVACRDLDDPLGIAIGLDNLGQIALHQSDYGHAQALFTESLQLCRRLGRKKTIAICLGGLAGVAAAQAAPVRAAHLCGAAEVILEAIRLPLAPADAVEYDRHKAIARAQLPPTVWEAAIAEGRAMPTEQPVDYALAS